MLGVHTGLVNPKLNLFQLKRAFLKTRVPVCSWGLGLRIQGLG